MLLINHFIILIFITSYIVSVLDNVSGLRLLQQIQYGTVCTASTSTSSNFIPCLIFGSSKQIVLSACSAWNSNTKQSLGYRIYKIPTTSATIGCTFRVSRCLGYFKQSGRNIRG